MQDFFLSILGSATTKRDARAYVKHYTPHKNTPAPGPCAQGTATSEASQNHPGGVNVGHLYDSRAVSNSPKFIQEAYADTASQPVSGPRHGALVKIRNPHEIDDKTLDGVARTLSQLAKLGMTSTVVVDIGEPYEDTDAENLKMAWRELAVAEADRVVGAIDRHSVQGARREDCLLGVAEKDIPRRKDIPLGGKTYVRHRDLLMKPLSRSTIPVVACIGYTDATQQAVPVKADDVMLALTREFAGFGFNAEASEEDDPAKAAERLKLLRSEVMLDRLIILDPLGGIPSSSRPNGFHVFLNMEQEYPIVKADLLATHGIASSERHLMDPAVAPETSDLATSNPLSKLVEDEFHVVSPTPTPTKVAEDDLAEPASEAALIHIQNLDLVRKVLSILPSTSSALLTTPTEAANSDEHLQPAMTGVGTRTQRNALIHNLLTDKPAFSSSLPITRLPDAPLEQIQRTTFAKRGMSVTIFPDPKSTVWQPPKNGKPQITLTDPRIDLPRLVHLINDSFDRKLNVPAYLERVNKRVAGVIIAGSYEGGALLTWELPPGIDPESPEADGHWVPYLDKFAVLKRSQGSGGVADVVFKAMVRECFPNGVCWRSRKSNPVNKWYFERSRGTWELPTTEWTLFWTTEGVERDNGVFKDYEAVCESIQPTWADKKTIMD